MKSPRQSKCASDRTLPLYLYTLTKYFAFALASVCASCTAPVTKSSSASSDFADAVSAEVLRPLALADDAVNLYQDARIESIVQDENSLTVTLREGAELELHEGNILVGQSTEDVFLRRVLNVEQTAPHVLRLETSGAELHELFSDGALRISGSALAENDAAFNEHAALLRTGGGNGERFHSLSPFNDSLGPLAEVCDIERETQLDIRPSINFGPEFTIEADFSSEGNGRYLRAFLSLSLGAHLFVGATGKLSFSCAAEKQLARIQRRQFFTVPTPAGPVPVMLSHRFTPTLSASFAVSAEAEGKVAVGKLITTDAGVAYQNGRWEPIFNPPQEREAITAHRVEAEAEFGATAMVGVHLAYQGLLYGLYGPYVEVEPRIEGSASAADNCNKSASMDAIVDGVYGFSPPRNQSEDQRESCTDTPPRWNGRPKHVTGCRCSAEVNADFEAAFKRQDYRKVTTLNRRQEYDVMREWYLNGRCTRGKISLGRFPDFVDEGERLGYPYLNVPQDDMGTPNDPSDDRHDWTQGVNDAWLQGAMDRNAPIYMATDPCDESGRSYWKDPDDRSKGRPVTYHELQRLERNGYRVDTSSCDAMKPPAFEIEGATLEFELATFEIPMIDEDELERAGNCNDDDDGDNGNGGSDGNDGREADGDGSDDEGDGGDGAEDAARELLCLGGQSICCATGSQLTQSGTSCTCGDGYALTEAGDSCELDCPEGATPNGESCECDGEAGLRLNEDESACISAGCTSNYPVFDASLDACRSREVCVEVHSTSSCVRYSSPWDSGSCLDGWGEEPNVNRYSIGEWATLPSLVQEADSFFQSCGSGGCSWAKDHCFIGADQSGWIRHTPAIWQGLRPDGSSDNFEYHESQTRASTGSAYAPGTLTGYRSRYIGYGGGTHYNYCGAGGGQPIVTTLEDTYWCSIQP